MGVHRDPILADSAPRQRHRGAAGAIVRSAVRAVAGRVEHAHADRGQPVGRHDGADVVLTEPEAGSDRPDIAPLRAFGRLAPGDEVLEGAEGDHILGKQRMRAGEIDRLHLLR